MRKIGTIDDISRQNSRATFTVSSVDPFVDNKNLPVFWTDLCVVLHAASEAGSVGFEFSVKGLVAEIQIQVINSIVQHLRETL